MNLYPMRTLSLATLPLLLLAGACTLAPIKVGYISPETGNSTELGVAGRRAATMAVEAINATGGIHGRSLELVPRDDRSSIDGGLQAIKELEAQGIKLVIGPLASSASTTMVPYANDNGILVLSPLVSAHVWSGKDDYFTRIIISNRSMGQQLAHRARKLGLSTMLGFFDPVNRLYAESFVNDFRDQFVKEGGSWRLSADLPGNEPDAQAAATKLIMGNNVDSIIAIVPGMDLALLGQKLEAAGWKGRILSGPWGMDDNLRQYAGNAASQYFLGTIYSSEPQSPQAKAFFEAWLARYGQAPSMSACYSWEAVHVLAAALRAAPDSSPSAVKAALCGKEFQGLEGPFTIDAMGDTDRPMYFHEIRGQTYQRL